MTVIVDFLTDSAKIVFGYAVLGFFIPGIAGDITPLAFLGGLMATSMLLAFAFVLSKHRVQ